MIESAYASCQRSICVGAVGQVFSTSCNSQTAHPLFPAANHEWDLALAHRSASFSLQFLRLMSSAWLSRRTSVQCDL